MEELYIANCYQLANNEQTVCVFNDGQVMRSFENVLVEFTNFRLILVSVECQLGVYLEKVAKNFLCQPIAMEGRIYIPDINCLFSDKYTIAKILTIFLQGVHIIDGVSHLLYKIIAYK